MIVKPPPCPSVLVETEHLRLRMPRADDLDVMLRIFGSKEMMRHLGEPFGPAEIKERLERWEDACRKGDSRCGIIEKKTGETIGTASIHPSAVPDLDGVEISYVVLPPFQRRGFASEMAEALVSHALLNMGVPRVIITASPDNEYSNRIAEKLGFTVYGELSYDHTHLRGRTRHQIWIKERLP